MRHFLFHQELKIMIHALEDNEKASKVKKKALVEKNLLRDFMIFFNEFFLFVHAFFLLFRPSTHVFMTDISINH